jgi:hypothetical protein
VPRARHLFDLMWNDVRRHGIDDEKAAFADGDKELKARRSRRPAHSPASRDANSPISPDSSPCLPTHAGHHDSPSGGSAGIGARITDSELVTFQTPVPQSARVPGSHPFGPCSRMMCSRLTCPARFEPVYNPGKRPSPRSPRCPPKLALGVAQPAPVRRGRPDYRHEPPGLVPDVEVA